MRIHRLLTPFFLIFFICGKQSVFSSLLLKEHVNEYVLDDKTLEMLNKAPHHLKPYLLSRMTFVRALKSTWNQGPLIVAAPPRRQRNKIKKMQGAHVMFPPLIKLDFSIKYKGVKVTKGDRPLLQLNYLAREGEIAEGFEASENLKGFFSLNDKFKIVSYIGLFEKWVSKYSSNPLSPVVDTKVTGTLKCAMGWIWSIPFKKHKKIEFDFLMQQTANNQWSYKESNFLYKGAAPAAFDHLVMTIKLRF